VVEAREAPVPTNLESALAQPIPVTPASTVVTARDSQELDKHDKNVIKMYIKGSDDINKKLRAGVIDPITQKSVEDIVWALDKLPPFEGTVHRGAEFQTEFIKMLRNDGVIFTDKAFLSTSMKTLDF